MGLDNAYEIFTFLYHFILLSTVLSVIELYFFCRFSGVKQRPIAYVVYIAMSLAVGALEVNLPLSSLAPLFMVLRIVLLTGLGAVLTRGIGGALYAAIVTKAVSLLSSALMSTFFFIFSNNLAGLTKSIVGLYIYGILWPILDLIPVVISYYIILKWFYVKPSANNRYFFVFLLPILLIIIVEQYIVSYVYGNEIVMSEGTIIKPLANNHYILLIHLLAILSLYCTLYALKRINLDFINRARLLSLTQAVAAERAYVNEAKLRYRRTAAFRHDIKGHLTALKGLLENGKYDEANDYLSGLFGISGQLSLLCDTGNTVVDTLVSSKLTLAGQNGIETECAIKLPTNAGFNDLDLCILFSNALDNAINACVALENPPRYIKISGAQNGDFFMISVQNSCGSQAGFKRGIGLSNIEAVAESYGGAVTAEKQDGSFSLSILLLISRGQSDITGKGY